MNDLTTILAWIVAANTVMSFASTAYTLLSARATRALKAIAALETKLDKTAQDRSETEGLINGRFKIVEDRMMSVESDIRHLPDRDHAHKMELAMEQMNGSVESLDERVTGNYKLMEEKLKTMEEKLKPIAYIAQRLQDLEFDKASGK